MKFQLFLTILVLLCSSTNMHINGNQENSIVLDYPFTIVDSIMKKPNFLLDFVRDTNNIEDYYKSNLVRGEFINYHIKRIEKEIGSFKICNIQLDSQIKNDLIQSYVLSLEVVNQNSEFKLLFIFSLKIKESKWKLNGLGFEDDIKKLKYFD